jgi:hypothetical protein
MWLWGSCGVQHQKVWLRECLHKDRYAIPIPLETPLRSKKMTQLFYARKRALVMSLILVALTCFLSEKSLFAAKNESHKPPRWELGISFNLDFMNAQMGYEHTYSPRFTFYNVTDLVSTATQELNIRYPGSDPGIGLMINFLAGSKWGLQLLVDSHKSNLRGSGNSHYSFLSFTHTPWPSFQEKELVRELYKDFPDTTGFIKQSVISINLFTRHSLGRNMAARFSGGISFFQVRGEVEPLGYIAHIEGHNMFYSFHYYCAAELKSHLNPGGNLGVELYFSPIKGISLFLASRFYMALNITLDLQLIRANGPGETGSSQDQQWLDRVQEEMTPQIQSFKNSFLSLSFGIKFSL